MEQGKRDTTRNISCSISFSATFHVTSGNFDYFFDSVGGRGDGRVKPEEIDE